MARGVGWGVGVVVALTAWGSAARADDTTSKAGQAIGSSGEWGGFYNGRTLGPEGRAFVAEAGWPGLTAGVLFGVRPSIDLGVKVSALYAGDFVPGLFDQSFGTEFGTDVRGVARFSLYESDSFSVLARVEPGVRIVAFNPVTWGIEIVGGVDAGIKVMPGGSVYVGVELPLTFYTSPFSLIQIPILAGGGFEYHLNDFIGVGARLNVGPSIELAESSGGNQVEFALIASGLFIYRWDRVK